MFAAACFLYSANICQSLILRRIMNNNLKFSVRNFAILEYYFNNGWATVSRFAITSLKL